MTEGLIAQMKSGAADPTRLPVLAESLSAEVARVADAVRSDDFSATRAFSTEELDHRVDAFEGLTAELAKSLALVAHWGNDSGAHLLGRLIGRLTNAPGRTSGQGEWLELDRYPALLALYSAGVGAVLANRDRHLAPILAGEWSLDSQGRFVPNTLVLYSGNVIDHRIARQLPGLDRRHTPVSDHLAEVLGQWLVDLEPDNRVFERAFDRFELLLGLVFYDLASQRDRGGWAPVGRFCWRNRYDGTIWDDLAKEIRDGGERWPLLEAGLFGGSADRLAASLKAYVGIGVQAASQMH